ncbi:MAG: hypothetical protein ACXABY_30605 [Candidatus Thorarchaeota archaeon]|jgi:hypothetical protein
MSDRVFKIIIKRIEIQNNKRAVVDYLAQEEQVDYLGKILIDLRAKLATVTGEKSRSVAEDLSGHYNELHQHTGTRNIPYVFENKPKKGLSTFSVPDPKKFLGMLHHLKQTGGYEIPVFRI